MKSTKRLSQSQRKRRQIRRRHVLRAERHRERVIRMQWHKHQVVLPALHQRRDDKKLRTISQINAALGRLGRWRRG